ncbi:HNH endonuclease [Delftia sp. Lp-1]|uniref:GmrSD restriction endonuclease domain-containing protein n=1 Tax=Delftia sp. Lp-1 TaxID=682863 RepID=UPI001E3815C1|nr:DUF262 domain-containing protein [Delftia sp. Lp-1]MCB4787349.1 HNH endonuclease [Delftia sp. Lp-1]
MVKRVILDAMIPREDFAITEETFDLDLFRDFPISNLNTDSSILRLLRKPDFQRETNQWSPDQIATFIASFLDNEVIPSLILWKSPKYVFVIDGGHRLSALRAWMEDDYGDNAISASFFKTGISNDQKTIARRTRQLVEEKVGKFSYLKGLVGQDRAIDPKGVTRASRMVTRALNLQWIQGNADAAETSFFKINSQGTPLDETEELLIKNRKKPISIAARAILRAGTGHKYWSSFTPEIQEKIVAMAESFNELLFKPEASSPIRTLDVPIGGAVSPVDALALLIEFLLITSGNPKNPISIKDFPDDQDGQATIKILQRSATVLARITGNSPGSLGLHPAIYFYNEKGKYNRFLFLGVCHLISEKLADNDQLFFKKFTNSRKHIEDYLLKNKSIIGLALQNMSKSSRIKRMAMLFKMMIDKGEGIFEMKFDDVLRTLGLTGKILEVTGSSQHPVSFNDDTKSAIFIETALTSALKCPICEGYIIPGKSVSYDHIERVKDGGRGSVANGQMTHPYCNTGMKN